MKQVSSIGRSDILVIGAGSSGCALAAHLALTTHLEVGLVEAGPDYGAFTDGQWPDELCDPRRFPRGHDWGFTEEHRTAARPEPRARVVGGCSAHNQCATVWGAPADYDGWAAAGNSGWGQAELNPLLDRVEATLQPRPYQDDDLASWQRAFVQASRGVGFGHDDRPGRTGRGGVVGGFPATIRQGVRWHAGFAFLDAARPRPKLNVADGVLADRLMIDSGRATALACYVDGERFELAADRFVLAAGVYGSPAILLRSGIGPQHELRRIGVAPEIDLQGVGRNLHDHPGVAVRFEPTRAAVRHLQADVRSNRLYQSQVILKAGAEAIDGDVALHLLPYQAPSASGDWRFEILIFAMRPRSRGSLTLRSTSPSDPPRIDFRFLTDRDGYDRSVLRRGVELSRWIARSSGLRELVAAELEPGVTAATTDRLDRYLENTVGGYGHAVGTCRMGPASDPEAVVDRLGRVHGTENVFVADASIMPWIPAANTNLTCYVIGRHIAELLVEQDPDAQSI